MWHTVPEVLGHGLDSMILKVSVFQASDSVNLSLRELFLQPWKGLQGPLAEDGDQGSGKRTKGLRAKAERAELPQCGTERASSFFSFYFLL